MSNVTSQNVSFGSLLAFKNNDFKEFVCGWGAAVINVSITFPINKIIFRQVCRKNMINTLIYLYIYICIEIINFLLFIHRFWKGCQPILHYNKYPKKVYDCYIVEFYPPFAKKRFHLV